MSKFGTIRCKRIRESSHRQWISKLDIIEHLGIDSDEVGPVIDQVIFKLQVAPYGDRVEARLG